MPKLRVNTEGLNLRRTPKIEQDNIIAVLPLAQEVDVLEEPAPPRQRTRSGRSQPTQGFVEITTNVDGELLRGFVKASLLRKATSTLKEALIHEAVQQWIRFDRGNGLEHEVPFFKFVGEFWKSIDENLDGRDRDQPWSAAFISFIVRRAEYTGFRFAAAHAAYINDAKLKRQNNVATAPFWLFRLDEHKPQLGDLVCKRRQAGITFDILPKEFKSHTDVIAEVRDNVVRAIGGNVGQSVSITSFALDNNGFLRQEGNVFAVMRNNK